ncbi:hypothetical protein [Cytobacillus horneckiae]|uniref:Uncharacterized protein n=1 Tax=Cytobacillus horneckiae TaxID=549687 RepID=A0A2N0ZF95_9BACI|nr:hypothetical protein [Cytobacillus horneckiae]MEC1155637.1 hypothetical protein [Cytobacillus horneckiae]MED2936955.1 hypothetical protein [Cytobacillus horneckiae]PKG28191.1 hypothetical protein CWS20_15215 [Cytobacillus horneckiae]
MAKKFKANMLKKEVQNFYRYLEFPLSYEDNEYLVRMYPFFKPEKINNLLNKMAVFFKTAKEENVKIDPNHEADIVSYYILREFTDIQFTASKKPKTIYDEFKIILNSPICQKLLKSFPKESIEQVYDRIHEVIEMNDKIKEQRKLIVDSISGLPLDNEFIKDKVLKQVNK